MASASLHDNSNSVPPNERQSEIQTIRAEKTNQVVGDSNTSSSKQQEEFSNIDLSTSPRQVSPVPNLTAPPQYSPSAAGHDTVASTNGNYQPVSQPPPPAPLQNQQQFQQPSALPTPSQGQAASVASSMLSQQQQRSVQSVDSSALPKPSGNVRIGKNGNSFNLKQWSTTTYRYAKQMINEKIGRGTRTFDSQLEGQIQALRETQYKYTSLLLLIKQFIVQFKAILVTQANLGDAFADLAARSTELETEFSSNAKTQRAVHTNGEVLISAVSFVVSSLTTLCDKTMADTLETIKVYENARIEYDAIRNEVESYPESNQSARAIHLRHEFTLAKAKFEKLRNDVSVKLKFLEENKVKVMHKQLVLFHDALCAYFSGNKTNLRTVLQDFHLTLATEVNTNKPSFLESN